MRIAPKFAEKEIERYSDMEAIRVTVPLIASLAVEFVGENDNAITPHLIFPSPSAISFYDWKRSEIHLRAGASWLELAHEIAHHLDQRPVHYQRHDHHFAALVGYVASQLERWVSEDLLWQLEFGFLG